MPEANEKKFGNVMREISNCIKMGVPYRPLDMKLYLTKRCNMKCIMCSNWVKSKSAKEELSTNEIYSVIDEAQELGLSYLTLFGGEPTLRDDLCDIVSHASEQGIHVRLVTNGFLIRKKLALRLVKAGLGKIVFSIDSPFASVHDDIRAIPGSFEKAVKASKEIDEAKRKMKSNVLKYVHTVVLKSNYKQLPLMVRFASLNNFDWTTFTPAIPNQGYSSKIFEKVYLSRNDIIDYNKSVAPRIRKAGVKCGYDFTPEDIYIFGTSNEDIFFSSRLEYSRRLVFLSYCLMPWYHVTIREYGNVLACNKIRDFVMGNIRRQPLKEIWVGKRYKQFRRTCRTIGQYKFPGCSRCCYHVARRHYIATKMLRKSSSSFSKKFALDSFPRIVPRKLNFLNNE